MKQLRDILLPAVNIVSFDAKAAFICGSIRNELELKGEPLSLADLQIAAIALSCDLILITGNIKHFKRIPSLKVENWL